MRDRRALTLIGVLAVALAVVAVAGIASRPRSAAERDAAARELAAGVALSAQVSGVELAATRAVADFGVEGGVRAVGVRIVDRLSAEVRIETPADVEFAAPPRLCLFWKDAAPDDAGLSDKCWGEPDLSSLLGARLGQRGDGRLVIAGGAAHVLGADLVRGDERCDYPPGDWRVELRGRIVIDGTPVDELDLAVATLDVPYDRAAPLPFVSERRYCGLATVVYQQQGEPPLASPGS